MRSGGGARGIGGPWFRVVRDDRRAARELPAIHRPIREDVVDRRVGIGGADPAALAPRQPVEHPAGHVEHVVGLERHVDHVLDHDRMATGPLIASPGGEGGRERQDPARVIEVGRRQVARQGPPPAADTVRPEHPLEDGRRPGTKESGHPPTPAHPHGGFAQRRVGDGAARRGPDRRRGSRCCGRWCGRRPRAWPGPRRGAGRVGPREQAHEAAEDAARRIPPDVELPVPFVERRVELGGRGDLDVVSEADQRPADACRPRVRIRRVADQDHGARSSGGHLIPRRAARPGTRAQGRWTSCRDIGRSMAEDAPGRRRRPPARSGFSGGGGSRRAARPRPRRRAPRASRRAS